MMPRRGAACGRAPVRHHLVVKEVLEVLTMVHRRSPSAGRSRRVPHSIFWKGDCSSCSFARIRSEKHEVLVLDLGEPVASRAIAISGSDGVGQRSGRPHVLDYLGTSSIRSSTARQDADAGV